MIGSLISGGLGLIGSIASNSAQRNNSKAQRKFDEEQNRINREWNAAQAEKANQWSIDQWHRNNEYNSPAAQRARMAAAGVNPDLMYGQSSGGSIASSSPSVTPTSPSQPTQSRSFEMLPTYGNVVSSITQMALAASQLKKTDADIKNVNADTSNKDVENSILSADALTRAAQNEQTLEFTKSQVYVNHSIGTLNHKQLEVLAAKIGNLDAQTNSLYESIATAQAQRANVNMDTLKKQAETFYMSKQFDLQVQKLVQDIRESDSRVNLNYAQAKDILITQSSRLLNLNMEGILKRKTAVGMDIDNETKILQQIGVSIANDQAKFNFDSDKDFKSLERSTGIATKWIDSLSSAVKNITGSAVNIKKIID